MTTHKRACDFLSEFFQEFVSSIRETHEPELKSLYLKKSVCLGEYSPLLNIEHDVCSLGMGKPKKKYDLIFLNPSFSKIISNSKDDPYINQISGRLDCLTQNGISFVLMPSYEISLSNKNFVKKLGEKGFYINGVLRLPEGFLRPDTGIRPLLVCVTRKETPYSLFAEFEGWEANLFDQFSGLCVNLLNIIFLDWNQLETVQIDEPIVTNETDDIEGEDLWNGIYSDFDEFIGFEYWKINDELERINSDYKHFKPYKFLDLIKQMKIIRSGETHNGINENCIYLPIIGNQEVISSISEFKIKPHNYAQILLDTMIVDRDYLISFLNSKIGQLKINAAKNISNQVIPKLSKAKIENIEIRIPDLQTQKKLLEGVTKVKKIYSTVERIKNDIELNPLSSKDIEKLDAILNSMSEFSIQDLLRKTISIGENKTTEFKETLSLDKKTQQKNKLLEHSALKNIVGFLNSDGGTLLVGVSDNKEITGINDEIQKFHKSEDKFLLHFKNLFKRSIGEEFYNFYETQLIYISEKIVLRVDVTPSDKEVFLDGKEFFVRTNPSTDKLEGAKLLEYCKRRFSPS